ncbi:hypothetical protein GA0061096_1388 [Fictibacillus enclensis]|nr:hypothetical protein GA0061096_1388 [Fictibacillus enclensis]
MSTPILDTYLSKGVYFKNFERRGYLFINTVLNHMSSSNTVLINHTSSNSNTTLIHNSRMIIIPISNMTQIDSLQ